MQATLTFKGTPLYILTEQMADRLDMTVRGMAFKVEAAAKSNAPVDTGALKSSIYTVTSRSTTYEKAVSAANSLYATKHGTDPLVILPRMGRMRKGEAWVIVAVEYGLENELNNKTHGHFMQRALDGLKDEYLRRCKEALQR